MKNKNDCEFEIVLSNEENEAMAWIGRVLTGIRNAGPQHKNYENARVFTCALNRIQRHCHEMHLVAHELEKRGVELVATKAQMMVQPLGQS